MTSLHGKTSQSDSRAAIGTVVPKATLDAQKRINAMLFSIPMLTSQSTVTQQSVH